MTKDDETECEWTGWTSSGDCMICKTPDKPTMEFDCDGKTGFLCEDCAKEAQS